MTQQPDPSGTLHLIDAFPSAYVAPRPVRIWLPPGYDSTRRYAVLYMQDGQMLFDSNLTWNHQAWMANAVATRLIGENKIAPVILVGIDNAGIDRNAEYFPQAALDHLDPALRQRIIDEWLHHRPLADQYLRFITGELKPYVDSTYATYPDRDHTFILGSSMGGLISLYAVCEYPDLFKGAGCMSTHWPMLHPVSGEKELLTKVPEALLPYLDNQLPSPESHRLYFDLGTEALDQLYGPYQAVIDSLVRSKGYNDRSWMTRTFAGKDHSEKAWRERLPVPLVFLLGRD